MRTTRSQAASHALPLPAHALLSGTLLAAALMTAAVLLATPAAAGSGFDPNYRYCVSGQADPFGSIIPDCSFTTYEQCRMAASGMGYCIDNPAYARTPAQRVRTKA